MGVARRLLPASQTDVRGAKRGPERNVGEHESRAVETFRRIANVRLARSSRIDEQRRRVLQG